MHSTSPRNDDINRVRQLARARAYRRLAAEFVDRFDTIHDEERVKVGLARVQHMQRQDRVAS